MSYGYKTTQIAAKAAGHAFYLPDDECKYGHLSVHRASDGLCTSCIYDAKQRDKLDDISIALAKDETHKKKVTA